MNVFEVFNVGFLEEVVEIVKGEVKSNLIDVLKWLIFCEMFCWIGDFECVDK